MALLARCCLKKRATIPNCQTANTKVIASSRLRRQVADSQEKCQGEKAALEQTEREECQTAKTAQEQNTRERLEKCESEKTVFKDRLALEERLINRELSGSNKHTLCPKYNGRDFETMGPNGSKHKWRILCDTAFGHDGISFVQGGQDCSSPYQQLKEMHELRAFAFTHRCYPLTVKPGYPPSHLTVSTQPNIQQHVIVRIDY